MTISEQNSGDTRSRAMVRVGLGDIHATVGSFDEVLGRILAQGTRRDGEARLVVTPNIAHVWQARRLPELRQAYEQAWLAPPDGWPVARAVGNASGCEQERVTGSDLVRALTQHPLKLALVGGRGDTAQLAADALTGQGVAATATLVEPVPSGELDDPVRRQALLERLRSADADVYLLGLGVPKQERLALELLPQLRGGIVMCIGAGLEFLAGTEQRASDTVQRMGLEWAHRVVHNPRKLAARYALSAPYFAGMMLRHPPRASDG